MVWVPSWESTLQRILLAVNVSISDAVPRIARSGGMRTIYKHYYRYEVRPVDEEHCSRCEAETHEGQRCQHQFPSAPSVNSSNGKKAENKVDSSY